MKAQCLQSQPIPGAPCEAQEVLLADVQGSLNAGTIQSATTLTQTWATTFSRFQGPCSPPFSCSRERCVLPYWMRDVFVWTAPPVCSSQALSRHALSAVPTRQLHSNWAGHCRICSHRGCGHLRGAHICAWCGLHAGRAAVPEPGVDH